ncbi:uncharacterized protein LODBEIA_P33500 [Lodderomyces beijingensis]|uniref:CNNM transmembrane domain-containing protein n=1 Tax=Lodderomyces beijingensis TaxID=1775926 RepID=A0ABP0ZPT3_9ASCO
MLKSKLPSRNIHGSTVSLSGNNAIAKVIFLFTNLYKLAHAVPIHLNKDVSAEGKKSELTPNEYYANLFVSILLVLLGGVFAGLTLGLMGQDEVYLKVIATSGDNHERKHARKVLRLIGRGKHWVLVTLLLSNVITNESLPIVLDRCLGGGWPAVVASTVSIVIFGEIIPQSICVRYGLQVGALFAPFVLVLMYIMYPVAYPCAMLLDHILGEDHGTVYKKSGLKTLVTLHKTMGVERLNQDEVTIISAVLDLKEKSVSSIMTPMERVYTMSADTLLDEKTVEEIFNAGFSRIPIHLPNEPNNFIGMLLVRVLISYDPEDALPVASFPLATLPETGVETSCLNILNYFQEGKSHMIIVSETPGEPTGAIGVLTLEDVIEELIGEEIVDESDVYIDINKNIKRKNPGPLSKRNLTAYLHNLYQRGAAAKRNSIDSSEPPPDLKERLTRQGSQATVISYTPNHRNHKHEGHVEASTSANTSSQGGMIKSNEDSANANANALLHANAGAGAGAGAGGTKWKLKNPAMNPLETSKPFVTIKKPDQGAIDSAAKAASPVPIPHDSKNPQKHGQHGSHGQHGQVGEVFSSEQGAIEEAKRRSFEIRSRSATPNPHPKSFLLPDQKETDVSEITGNHNSQHLHDPRHIDIPLARRNEGYPELERQESRSYRTGGIVESVINCDGVHKTIIENVSDRDDDDGNNDDIVFEDPMSHSSKKKKRSKKKSRSGSGSGSGSRSNSFSMSKLSDEEEEHQSLLNGLNGSRHSSASSTSSGNRKKLGFDKERANGKTT